MIPEPVPEQTLIMPVIAEDTETLEAVPEAETEALAPLPAVPETPDLSNFSRLAEAEFLDWMRADLARWSAEEDKRVGDGGTRPDLEGRGAVGRNISQNLDAGMLACRRIAAQAAAAHYGTAPGQDRPLSTWTEPAAWPAPLPAIAGLPRHGRRRNGDTA